MSRSRARKAKKHTDVVEAGPEGTSEKAVESPSGRSGRKMLINAQTPEELRIAIVDGTRLEGYQVEVADRGLDRGNIYRGVVVAVQPGLNAAFVDYGADKNGFLSLQDLVPQAYHRQPEQGKRPRIEWALEKGKPVVVQVTKDAEGSKGAALTTNISLAGRYLVFTPFDDTRGISRKLEDEEERRKLREVVESLRVPEKSGYIIRTNAVGQTKASLSKDLAALLRLWKKIESEYRRGKGAKALHQDQDIILRALRDTLDTSIAEVIIDDDAAFEKARDYIKAFVPRSKTRLERYTDRAPLFSKYALDEQIDRIFDRQVELAGGGSIVIDRTEALVAIDVNSGKGSRGNQAATALQTNLEAAAEVARQLRLRDIGGLIVVDFIDMRSRKDDARVEKALREAMKVDKARFSVGNISSNGLLEINRQKIQQALQLRTHRACPTCEGTGRIASVEMVGLNLLRRIETRAATSPVGGVRISLHPELADAVQNGRRREIAKLEEEFDLDIEILSSNKLHRPEQVIEWIDRAGDERPQQRPANAHHSPPPKEQKPAPKQPAEPPRAAAPSTAPPPTAVASQPQGPAEPSSPKRRSRRRRRRRGGSSEPAAQPAAEVVP